MLYLIIVGEQAPAFEDKVHPCDRLVLFDEELIGLEELTVQCADDLANEAGFGFLTQDGIFEEIFHFLPLFGHAGFEDFMLQSRW